MASSAGYRTQKHHVLDFFYDKENGSVLTVLVNGVRFHAFVDWERLTSSGEKDNADIMKYFHLHETLKITNGDDHAPDPDHHSTDPNAGYGEQEPKDEEEKVYCICRGPDRGFMIGCDECDEWFHGDCVGVVEDQKDSIDKYTCPGCKENKHEGAVKSPSRDSGVVLDDDKQDDDPEAALQDWILSFLEPEISKCAPARQSNAPKTVQDWYHPETKYYTFEQKSGTITPIELEETPELLERMTLLLPKVTMPKYILNQGIPWFSASDLEVLEESNTPEPIHPSIIRHDSKTYFLKVVDSSQPGPTKRELKIMKEIEKLGLQDQIRTPQVLGLVGFGNTKTEIMGFLQTNIEAAEPLTHMLESDVPQEKRDRWAAESERMVGVLHKNNIIWGDAKADNFMVDKDEKLWIIDFGGSYTEGWIDAELNETEEGDDMGTVKIVNALHDPDANTLDPEEDNVGRAGVKRSHPEDVEEEGEGDAYKRSRVR